MKEEKKKIKRNAIFDSKYTVNEFGCWVWKGEIDRNGYGRTAFRKNSDNEGRLLAHRYSYERYKGEIPAGLHVCHDCPNGDNRACVNPDHLWIGTSLENNRDKGHKGNQCKGVTNGQSKLSEDDVKNIRRRFGNGEFGTIIAKDYGVSPGLIYHIKNGKAWKHTIEADECEKLKKIKKNHPVKLSEKDVREIRSRNAKGERVSDLAKEYDVQTTMISRIKNGRAWKHVK